MALAQVTLVGVDGERWVIHGPGAAASPARMLEGGVGDLFDAPVSVSTRATAASAGAHYLGHRIEERTIVLNLITYSDVGSKDWSRTDAALRRAFAYDQDARLEVQTEESGVRWIGVRLAEAPSYERDFDPHMDHSAIWTITLTALDPYWHGDDITEEVQFSGANFQNRITVQNPGDVPSWPKYVMTAPARWALPNPSWDKDNPDMNRLIWFPMQPAGRELYIDTDPGQEMVVASDDNGSGAWAMMNGQFFSEPIPPETRPTTLPVEVDPVPYLPWQIPSSVRAYLAQRVRDKATELGDEGFFDLTTQELAELIEDWLQAMTPPIMDWLSFDILDRLVAPTLAPLLADIYGSTIRPLLGATVQIIIPTRYNRPW